LAFLLFYVRGVRALLTGQKTGLRAVESSDLEILRDWRNIPDYRKHFREHRELNLENQKRWFERTVNSSTDFMFVILDLRDMAPIGACGLLYTNWVIRSADFSFYIGRDGAYIDDAGFAEDAAVCLVEYGFMNLNLNKMWMELYEFDSKKLDLFVGKLGFKHDGRLRQNCFYDGRYWDSFIVSLLKDEWFESQNHLD
jgi:RimJ/RimL family protein N-acetyltransferase